MTLIKSWVDKTYVLSATQIGMLDRLGLNQKIKGIANVQYVYNPQIRQGVRENKIQELGEDATLNTEKIVRSRPDIIFVTGWDKMNPNYKKLIEQQIPVAFVMDWQEESPLARAEWIKFVAAFYGLDQQANQIFDSIEHHYNRLINLAKTTSGKPTVMHGTPMSGTWYIAGGKSYAAHFYKDANASYLWSNDNSTGSLPLNFEAVFKKASQADFWFNSSSYTNLKELGQADQRYLLFKSFKQKQIYSNGTALNSKSPNSFWEEGTINPDLVLKDIISIIHPEVLPNYHLKYYRLLD